jgi:pyruvate kinase
MRHTKIVATLGPASFSHEAIAALAAAGASTLRINGSHTAPDEVAPLVERIRAAAPHVAVLLDVQGPKLRLGDVSGSLTAGETVTIGPAGTLKTVFDLYAVGVRPGHRILLDDGRLELLATHTTPDLVTATVVSGGDYTPRRGVNLPDTLVALPALSAQDEAHVEAGLNAGVEWIALSFVQTPADVAALRAMVGSNARILAKIERPQALEHLDEIAELADGLMAARGDLGVELPFELVPAHQSRIANCAQRHGIVSVCATEMLESMRTASRPTRAEVQDITSAVQDGFDAVMLSAETATGHDPALAVTTMARVAAAAESHRRSPFANENPRASAVTAAAASLAHRLDATCIISLTTTGFTADLLSACRPSVPVVACTPSPSVQRALQLRFGVTPLIVPRPADITAAAAVALDHARAAGICAPGDQVVLCASRATPHRDVDTLWVETA